MKLGITYPFAANEHLFTYKQFYEEFTAAERKQWQLLEDDPDMMKMKVRRLASDEPGKSPWHEKPGEAGPTHQHFIQRATP